MPYQIPSKRHRTELEINRSLFITTIAFAEEVEDAKHFIGAIRSEMPDANHHVYAYRIGFGSSVIEGMSDAGELSGTSGPPTLAVLRGANIGDIALVTTRYFGGTKLGTGGLVRAYTESAQLCLESLPLTLKIAKTTLTVTLHYRFYDMLERVLPDFDAEIQTTDFTADVSIRLELPVANVESFSDQVTELTNGSATII
jgi:uncharacterized YigZ family protein